MLHRRFTAILIASLASVLVAIRDVLPTSLLHDLEAHHVLILLRRLRYTAQIGAFVRLRARWLLLTCAVGLLEYISRCDKVVCAEFQSHVVIRALGRRLAILDDDLVHWQ